MEAKKILIVDDEIPISAYLQRKFTKLGYTVYQANDGEEALREAFLYLPDIILLDVKLPKLNGIEVCRRLKSDKRTKHTPIIILSAKAQSFEIQEGLDAGADKYLSKPISFPDILSEVARYIGN
ncbi:MAG: response regulator [Syntrophales bacterium]|nr:response regulator [Syntrophales bacterium]